MVSLHVLTTVVVVVVVGAAFCSGQLVTEDPADGSLESEAPTPAPRTDSPRTATFIPRSRFRLVVTKQSYSPEQNVIGKSPCPRGTRGVACRVDLALEAQTCNTGSCEQCRRECSSLSPSVWPTCCRDHFLCCRQLASACQQCNFPGLIPFCTAAFKKCF